MRIEQEMKFIADVDMRIYFGENYLQITPSVIQANPAIKIILDSIAFDTKKIGAAIADTCIEVEAKNVNRNS